MSGLAMKKYFYAFMKETKGFEAYDKNSFSVPFVGQVTMLEIFSLIFACYIGYGYHSTQFWIGNNMFALCLTVYAIETWLAGEVKLVGGLFLLMVSS